MEVPPNQTTNIKNFPLYEWSSPEPYKVHWVESEFLGHNESEDFHDKANFILRGEATNRFDDLVKRVQVGSLVLVDKDAPASYSCYSRNTCRPREEGEYHRIISKPRHLDEKL